jgi:preprotein translocase subunit SecB
MSPGLAHANFVKAGQAPRLNLSPVNLNAVFTPKLVATGSGCLQQ